ncbi:serine protease, partial [Flavobacterium sp. LBUM151]
EDDASLNPGQKAIMVGYPLGMDLAQTNSGIKVQLYDGKISKESDGNKIQYSITSTHGASGAPVFNECGQLIAVNFSGVDEVQGFNFGIVAKHIRTF